MWVLLFIVFSQPYHVEYVEVLGYYESRINCYDKVKAVLKDQPLISISSKGLQKHKISLWKKILDTNLSSVFYMTSNVVEKMSLKKTKGIIINVSSISSTGNPGQTAYSAAKAGVNALTKTWSKELNYLGIRVAGISPGFTKTKMILDGFKSLYNATEIEKLLAEDVIIIGRLNNFDV